jgi:putative Holliday junction resolvase
MGRIMAIDYGQKRAGLAVTDERQVIASGLATVHVGKLMDYLRDYFSREPVERLVIGEPFDMQYRPSDASRYIDPFIRQVRKQFPDIPVERMDERFTSKMAMQAMLDAGVKRKDRQRKELVDTISATILLQSFLESRQFKNQRL